MKRLLNVVNWMNVFSIGTNVGDIASWEVRSSEKLTHRSFKDWDASNRTTIVQV